ncbi:MAG: hypothetical protein JRJ19_02760 [Deltaproteobacteria bacterium]|nr:hypothetical protein [Deltaproteobacteria bacterium]MBW1870954.1 hypothetical protein [Deltaproteobacteria bacterium]
MKKLMTNLRGLFYLAAFVTPLFLVGCGGGGTTEGCTATDTFCVESDDRALAQSYNSTFDWSSGKIAVRLLSGPTRSEADKAIYFHNPGLYKDVSGEPQVTPDPLPTLDGSPSGFDFELSNVAPNPNQQFLDNSSIVDKLSETSISSAEQTNSVLYLPAIMVFLTVDWDAEKVLNLYYGYSAVRGQKWGGSSTLYPQSIQHVYLHSGEIWVEIVFEDFVSLGTGISDSNGDGYKEVFAKIAAEHFTAEVYNKLVDDYVTPRMTVSELNTHVEDKIVDDLYYDFPMEPTSGIGVPFEISGVGTVKFPFKVLQGVSPKDDIFIVLLVEP